MKRIHTKVDLQSATHSLSNYFGIHVKVVEHQLQEIVRKHRKVWKENSIPAWAVREFCQLHGLKLRTVPRRGQQKLTGVVILKKWSTSPAGEIATLISGHVFNPIANGTPIAEFRKEHAETHIREVWN